MLNSTIDGLPGSGFLRPRVWSVALIREVPGTASTVNRDCADCSSHAAIERAGATAALVFHVKRASWRTGLPALAPLIDDPQEFRFT
jgi:hypothetical protein